MIVYCVIVLQGSTLVIWAALNDHTDLIKVLIEAGADIEAKNNRVRSCLYQCNIRQGS